MTFPKTETEQGSTSQTEASIRAELELLQRKHGGMPNLTMGFSFRRGSVGADFLLQMI